VVTVKDEKVAGAVERQAVRPTQASTRGWSTIATEGESAIPGYRCDYSGDSVYTADTGVEVVRDE
jgi:hypothetical protein